MNSGKLVTIFVLLLGAMAAAAAWWHNMNKGRSALELWSGQVAHRIRTAESVNLWVLAPNDLVEPIDRCVIGGQTYPAERAIDISQTPGLVHARQALISDASFDWDAPPAGAKPRWQYAIRFEADGDATYLLLDLDRAWVAEGENAERMAKLKIVDGLKKFISEQVERDAPAH
jgi:hypothetical protein